MLVDLSATLGGPTIKRHWPLVPRVEEAIDEPFQLGTGLVPQLANGGVPWR